MRTLLIIAIVFTACSVTGKKSASEPLHYFACAGWTDLNHDGKYDYFEFENIKNSFNAVEEVLFVGFFDFPPAGSKLRFRLYSPDGSLVDEVTQIQLLRVALIRSKYPVGKLISSNPEGVWEGVWDVEEEVIAVTEVKLTR